LHTIGRQRQQAPDGTSVHCERHRLDASWPTASWGCAGESAGTTSYWPSVANAWSSSRRAALPTGGH